MNLKLLFALLFTSNLAFSQTTFASKQLIDATGDQPYNIAVGYIDGDIYEDIIIGTFGATHEIEWYKNNGDKTFTSQGQITNTLDGIAGLKLVDLNNDTYKDIVLTAYNNNKVVWFANDGLGNFGSEQTISTTTSGAAGLAVADLDNNNTPDVIVTANIGNQIEWYSNNGSGVFSFGGLIDNTIIAPGSINFSDIDADGDLDAVVTDSNFNNCQINIFRSSYAQNSLVNYTKDPSPVTTGKYYFFNATFNNVDGDENLDILATDVAYNSFPGAAYWYEFNGSGYTENQFTTSINNPSVMQLKDLDDDGLSDIVLSNGQGEAIQPGNTDLSWFKNLGGGVFGSETIIETTQSIVFVYGVSDLDNDLDLDIASLAYNNDALYFMENLKYTLNDNDYERPVIGFFPNPASDHFMVNGITETLKIDIFDMLGKSVLATFAEPNKPIDISNLRAGMYMIRIPEKNLTIKLLIN